MGCGKGSVVGMDPKVCPRLWPVVQAEHCNDDILQGNGNMKGAGAPAVSEVRMLVMREIHLERRVERGHTAGKDDGACAGVDALDGQTVCLCKRCHALDVVGMRAMGGFQLRVAQVLALGGRGLGQ
ncbi:hypothetical protein GCM10025857_17510 [Alicyclobacillus contaminans]|nr:hypothetical protein GCM10025857_17510 [Alicyclobacillus contaminans]